MVHNSQPRLFLSQFRWLPALLPLVLYDINALARDNTPPAPDKPWAPPQLGAYEKTLADGTSAYKTNGTPVKIDLDKVYDLPELIDIAERSHPDTRIAWEQARQAADAVGISRSAYYPYLAASAAAGFQRSLTAVGSNVFPADADQEGAEFDLQWLLLDFGGRKAAVTAAREKLMAANVTFNATHQQIVFDVTSHFYGFNVARQKVGVAESSLQAAQTVGQAAQARYDNGLATRPEVLEAEQETAQAEFDLESARGDLSDAQVSLMQSLGIVPVSGLQVADVPEKAGDFEGSLDTLIDRGLSQRPDLVAKLASVRASEAAVRAARSEYYPKVGLDTSVGYSKLDVSAYQSPEFANGKPVYGAGISISLPIFDGFLRANKLRAAKSQLKAAQDELTHSRDAAVSEVWQAYTDCKTAIRKQESAAKLLAAAQSAFDATLDSYRHGLSTYVDVANAQRNLTTAQSVVVDTRSAIFTTTAALALSVGDLARPTLTKP
jgi:outer membrane protein